MGAGYIGGGLTIEKKKDIGDIRAVVESFRDQIAAKLDDIDPAGYFDDEETAVDSLIDSIAEGVTFLNNRTGGRYIAAWDIPGNDAVTFLTFGGMSWGDSPFDEFDAVVHAGDAAAALPEFGRAVGILGGGIQTEYKA